MLLSNIFCLCVSGEARAALKWADGKILKNEVDMQVCEHVFISVLLLCHSVSLVI